MLLPTVKFGFVLDFCSVHKMAVTRSSVCRTKLIRSALESSDLCASDGGSNFSFRHFGADMAAFEVAGEVFSPANGRFVLQNSLHRLQSVVLR